MTIEVLVAPIDIYAKLLNYFWEDCIKYRNSFFNNDGTVSILIEFTYEKQDEYANSRFIKNGACLWFL